MSLSLLKASCSFFSFSNHSSSGFLFDCLLLLSNSSSLFSVAALTAAIAFQASSLACLLLMLFKRSWSTCTVTADAMNGHGRN